MSLNEEDIKAVVFYRKGKAYATLREVEDMVDTKHWNLAIQRMYYACFYMASALLVSAGLKSQTHNGVVGQLSEIRNKKTGAFGRAGGSLLLRVWFEIMKR